MGQYESFAGFVNPALTDFQAPGITVVRTKQDALKVLDVLYKCKDKVHAWDTETIDLEIKTQSPVGNGKIISAQVFCGPEAGFENGPRVFIDNFGECMELIQEFKDYFEDDSMKKVWFNYGFDRHVVNNHGIDLKGFHGDVMHMARLLDGSREPQAYSLSRVSTYYQKEIEKLKRIIINKLESTSLNNIEQRNLDLYKQNFLEKEIKVSMNKIFARRKVLKNGELGKSFEVC